MQCSFAQVAVLKFEGITKITNAGERGRLHYIEKAALHCILEAALSKSFRERSAHGTASQLDRSKTANRCGVIPMGYNAWSTYLVSYRVALRAKPIATGVIHKARRSARDQ